MTGCKIIDFCLQRSIETVGIHSVEAERIGMAQKRVYVSMHPVVMSLHPLIIPVRERL